MNSRTFLSVLFLIIIASPLFAQDEIQVTQLKQSSFSPVYDPFLLDSLDVNRKAYDAKNLLQTTVDFNIVRQSKNVLKANDEGVFILDYAPYNPTIMYRDKAIQLLAFHIDADRYCKAKLSVTATDRWELYINGEKQKSKEEKQDSISKAKTIDIDLTLEPQRYEVIIKRLAQVHNFDEAAMKITLKPEKEYASAEIKLSTDGKRRVTINDIIEGNRLTSHSLSPTGNYYFVRTDNVLPGDKKVTTMELREMKTNRVICPFATAIAPHWLDKTDKFIYSKSGATHKDLYLFDPATLQEERIAEDIQFGSYKIAPNNRFLIITRSEEIAADKGDLKRTLAPSDRSGSYRWRNSLYIYDFADSRTMQQIMYGRSKFSPADISPDSKKALIVVSEEKNERPFSTSCFMELDLLNLSVDTLFCDDFVRGARYSPNGDYLMLTGGPEAFNGLGINLKNDEIPNSYDTQAYLYDLKKREAKPITKDFDPSVKGIQWSEYNNMLYLRVEDKDRVQVYSYDLKSENFNKLSLPEDIITSFQMAYNSPVTLFRAESGDNSFRLYTHDLKSGKTTLLDDPFKEQLDELQLSPMKDWSFVSQDGSTIDGRYYLPYGYDSSQTYPMIVYYYGGTNPTTRVFESTYPLQTYAALGYVVLALNPSGTTGYGQDFSARHVNAWGILTADEIIEGTQKFCQEHSFVDATKLGCIGASYGGFMTQYILTQTDLFAAAISHAGISNIASYWGEGYWGYSYGGAASAGSYPWNNPELYVEQSPIFSADKINTPLLLLHGSADTNVPVGESIQMFNALRLLGKEVELIQVQGENHAIYNYKKRIEWNKTIHAWFAKWLKDQPEWWDSLYPEK